MVKFNLGICSLICFLQPQVLNSRSVHRKIDPLLPSITVSSLKNSSQTYTLTDSHLRKFPLFEAYNEKYLFSKWLPKTKISYRYEPHKVVKGTKLMELMNELVKEVKEGKVKFKNFIVLKKKDFNFETKCGLIILKFKDYPFVVKLFIEHPQSIVRPYSKGLFPMGMFMVGGSNRHFNGFTRIKNLENLQKQIQACPKWAEKISFPRKWFWIPEDSDWIQVQGKKLANQDLVGKFPACYAIVADEMKVSKDQSSKTSKQVLDLCNCLKFSIDPHFNNFMIEEGTGKIALYDTEHFPTLIGKYGSEFRYTQKYPGWYTRLVRKVMKERVFSAKPSRLKRQLPGSAYPLYTYDMPKTQAPS